MTSNRAAPVLRPSRSSIATSFNSPGSERLQGRLKARHHAEMAGRCVSHAANTRCMAARVPQTGMAMTNNRAQRFLARIFQRRSRTVPSTGNALHLAGLGSAGWHHRGKEAHGLVAADHGEGRDTRASPARHRTQDEELRTLPLA
jgi:hypothetical protein